MGLKLLRNLFRFKYAGLTLFATVYELMDHKWKGGMLACPHETYRLIIQQHVNGRLVGEIKVKTCAACDPGS